MPQKPRTPKQRVVVYISPQAYRRLRVLLAIEHVSVSEWFRRQAKELEENMEVYEDDQA
jgi:hypothetical protein